MGEAISARSSPSLGASTPPLKKKVTWAYFSVSAMRSCLRPLLATYSPSVLVSVWGLKAISRLVKVSSYLVIDTKCTLWYPPSRSKPSKSGSIIERVSSRVRSGRKLKNITLSPALTWATGRPPSVSTTVGCTNSSVSFFS